MKSLRELMDLTGRVACITGGAGHIGSAMADALAELGAAVVVVDLSPDRCAETALMLERSRGVESMPLPIDLAEETAVRSIPAAVNARFGRLDILIHCAALVGSSALT